MSASEFATLVCHFVRAHPEMFEGQVRQQLLPDVVTWEDEIRPATEQELEKLTRHVDPDRLTQVMSEKNASNLLFPVIATAATPCLSEKARTNEILAKSLQRLHTVFSHKSSNGLTMTAAPAYSVRIHGHFVFSGADDNLVRQFRINSAPSTPDEPMLLLEASFEGHTAAINDLAVFTTKSGETLVCSCSADKTVRVNQASPVPAALCSLVFDADVPYVSESDGRLVVCSSAGEVVVVSGDALVDSGTNHPGSLFSGRGLKRVFGCPSRHVHVRGFRVQGESMYLALSDKTIKVYNLSTCNLVYSWDLLRLHSKPVTELSFLTHKVWNSVRGQFADQELLASSDDSGNLVLWTNRSPRPLLSHGRFSDDTPVESRLKRLSGISTKLFFTLDVTAFKNFDSGQPPLLLASLSVFGDATREFYVSSAVLVFDTETAHLCDVMETFECSVFVIRPVEHSDLVMFASHDGDLAIFDLSPRTGCFTELTRFAMATRFRLTRGILDAAVKPTFSSGGGRRSPKLVDLTIACTDSFGCVSLFGASEITPLQSLDSEEAQRYRDAFSHQFFASDFSDDGQRVRTRADGVCDFRGRSDRLHQFPEDPLPSSGTGYELRGRLGEFPNPPPPLPSRTPPHSDSADLAQQITFMDMVDAGDVTDSSDTSFASSADIQRRQRRSRVAMSEESSGESRLTSLVDENQSSEEGSSDGSSNFGRRAVSRRVVPTRSRSIMGVYLSPAPSPPRRSQRPRRQIRYDLSESSEDAAPQPVAPARRLARRMSEVEPQVVEPAPVVEELWLACDHCDKWRCVSQAIFDEYNGTDKVVRCRRIGRSCDEPDENPDEVELPAPLGPREVAVPPVQTLDDDASPTTATGMTLRRRPRLSSSGADAGAEAPASPAVDFAMLRQERATRRERLRVEASEPRSTLRTRRRSERSSNPSEDSDDSSEASSHPRQPRRSLRRPNPGARNLRPRRN